MTGSANGPHPGPNLGPDDQDDAAARRRRRAEVFGEVLPETTGDERSEGSWDERPAESANDEWLKRQVPPHHG